jgi:ribosomal protein L40E
VDQARCPNCSALVSPDADWCGQCFQPLRAKAPAPGSSSESVPEAAPTSGKPVAAIAEAGPGEGGATWPCPTCGSQNPIDLDVCAVCGTSFAQLLRQQEDRPTVSPRDAFLWSLTFPGVGHAKAGRAADGIARGTLFVLTFGLSLVIVLSGVSNAPVFGVVAILLLSALVLYLGSAFEAYRLADGGAPFVSARALLWATVALIMVSVSLLALSVVGVTER